MRIVDAWPAVLLLALWGCSGEPEVTEVRFPALGTLVEISVYGTSAELAEATIAEVEKDYARISVDWYGWGDGQLARLNRALQRGESVRPDAELADVLRRAAALADRSGFRFDPTVGGLVEMWGFNNGSGPPGTPPTPQQLAGWVAARPTAAALTFDAATITSTAAGVVLDVGGFAKGIAVDRAFDRLRAAGMENFLVNAGGDLRAAGTRGDRPWRIGIKHPRASRVMAALEVRDGESVFTSGDYERFFFKDGARYHHILDPATGLPASGAQAITVVHSDAGTADAAATALFVAGPADFQRVAQNMGIEQVMLVDATGRILVSPRLARRLRFLDDSAEVEVISPWPSD